ncbi:melatonin receptor type 1B-B-like [Brachionus plicatilis]|uniref:Melatonin receptor type 1B-B-like n=1 Tax=Brachionus plicatilis TaxID=10195 RepID=A0A3M7T9L8_BRAPC|nr:melatonin receptor type 1B-B-like [Brachionus plicatilis]
MFLHHLIHKISNSNSNIFNLNESFDPTIDYGGIDYIQNDLVLYIAFLALTFFGIIFGFLGNMLTILAIIFNKELNAPNYWIIVNLSIADLHISSLINSFNAIGVLAGEDFFLNRKPLCTIIGFLCLIFCGSSLLNIALLALNRYIKICHDHLYSKIFSKKKTMFLCILPWLGGIALGTPNLSGWGGYDYDKKVLSCMTDRTQSQEFGFFYIFCYVLTPCICIFVCYLKIFFFVSKYSGKIGCNSHKKQIQLAKSLFASFITYFFCWMPFGFIYIIDHSDMLHPAAMVITTAFAHINSSVNAFYYAYFSSTLRRGFYKFIVSVLPYNFNLVNSSKNSHTSHARN